MRGRIAQRARRIVRSRDDLTAAHHDRPYRNFAVCRSFFRLFKR